MKLTLKDLETEAPEEPFIYDPEDGGEPFTFIAAPELPAETLMDIGRDGVGSNSAALQILLGDQYEGFRDRVIVGQHVTVGVLNSLMVAYNEHFGIASPGEGNASPAFSNRAARRSKRTSRSKA